MLEILKFLFGWADQHGAALIAGFLAGLAAATAIAWKFRCHYKGWVDAFRKDPCGWKK